MNNYKALYDFIDDYEKMSGNWHIDHEHKGTQDSPLQMPFVSYNEFALKFVDAFYENISPDGQYGTKMEKIGNLDDLVGKDLCSYNLEQLTTILTYIIRGNRFCEGMLLAYIKNGLILSILKAMKHNCEDKK